MKNILYGDGINDDTLALQEMIDSALGGLELPMPEKCYMISKPLIIPSNFKLRLPRYAQIKLMPNSNCVMLRNKFTDELEELNDGWIFKYIKGQKVGNLAENIEIEGGIWNFNNLEQAPNPMIKKLGIPGYVGVGMVFLGIKNFRLTSLTLKDPVTFAVVLDTVSYFTVDNIIFDYNYGNPLATNMDGIHINGNCNFGDIRNLKGACYDDLVALNVDEGTKGDISDITIDGLYAEDCHSAVRLLSANTRVKNIHISNVYGTYFQYCIGLTRYQKILSKGYFDGIVLNNISASKAERLSVYNKDGTYEYPLIYIQDGLFIKNLKISNLNRIEYISSVETINVGGDKGAVTYEEQDEIKMGLKKNNPTIVENLILENISVENHTSYDEIPLYVNEGTVKNLSYKAVFNDGKEVKIPF